MKSALKNKKILVVDDEQLILDIVKTVIKSEGGVAETKYSADNITRLLREQSYDLIILDRYLNDVDGIDVLKKIKSSDFAKHIPVIMLTGESAQKEIVKTIQAGASGYITKPFKPSMLIEQIKKVLTPVKSKDGFKVDV